MADGGDELLLGGAGTTVEDEEEGLLLGGANLLLGEGLVLAKELGVELDVTGLVDTVDVSETGGDREVGRDGGKRGVNLVDVLGLGVEGVVVDVGVVDTILLTTSDSNLLQRRSEVATKPSTGEILPSRATASWAQLSGGTCG